MPFLSRGKLQTVARRIRNLAISDALLERTLGTHSWKRAETEQKKIKIEKKIGTRECICGALGAGLISRKMGFCGKWDVWQAAV